MNCHAIFTDKDVFPKKLQYDVDVVFKNRLTGKAIVFDSKNNIALVGNIINEYYLLPGGGIEEGEEIAEGIIRECLEEIGCDITLVNDLGTIEDFRIRDGKHYITHCYTAKVIGDKKELKCTEAEKKNGMYVKWVSLDEAIIIMNNQKKLLIEGGVSFYNTSFNILRDSLFLIEAKKYFYNNEKDIFIY